MPCRPHPLLPRDVWERHTIALRRKDTADVDGAGIDEGGWCFLCGFHPRFPPIGTR